MAHVTKKYIKLSDLTANDASKTIAEEVGTSDYQLVYAHVSYTSTAVAGNRLLEVHVQDEDANDIIDISAGSFQAASLLYHYDFIQGIFRETVSSVAPTGIDGTIQVPLPTDFVILNGWTLHFRDAEAVDDTADDMLVSGLIRVLR